MDIIEAWAVVSVVKGESDEGQAEGIPSIYNGDAVWLEYAGADLHVHAVWRLGRRKVRHAVFSSSPFYYGGAGWISQYFYYGKKDLSGRQRKRQRCLDG